MFDDTPLPDDLVPYRVREVNLKNSIHDIKGYGMKLFLNEAKKTIVRMVPALASSMVIEDIKGPNEIAHSIVEALNNLIPPALA